MPWTPELMDPRPAAYALWPEPEPRADLRPPSPADWAVMAAVVVVVGLAVAGALSGR